MLANDELTELVKTIREGHCRSYVNAAKVLAEEFHSVLRTRMEDPVDLAVEYQHMFVNLTNSQVRCTELIQKNREQARQILQLEAVLADFRTSFIVKKTKTFQEIRLRCRIHIFDPDMVELYFWDVT